MSKTTESTRSGNPDAKLDKKALISKIHGLVSHQNALIQKKLRIDLEIKRTQQHIRKLRQKSTKTSSSLAESAFGSDPGTILRFLQEATPEERTDLELLQEIRAADEAERYFQELENYLFVPDFG